MSRHVTVDLDKLVALGVYPADTVFTNPRFRGEIAPGPDNAPFYRLIGLAGDPSNDSAWALPTDMEFNPYSDVDPIDIQAAGKAGKPVAHVDPAYVAVKVARADQVTFVKGGLSVYDDTLRTAYEWLRSGSPDRIGAARLPTVTVAVYLRMIKEDSDQASVVDSKMWNATEVFSKLPTEVLREFLESPSDLQDLPHLLTHFLVSEISLPGFRLDIENCRYPEGDIEKHQIFNLILETGRVEEFDDLQEVILENGHRDSVDRFTSMRAEGLMLEHEPNLQAPSTGSPSP